MNPFIGSEPDLINGVIIKEIEDKLNTKYFHDNQNIFNGLGFFYRNYIQPNMFPIIVISFLILYLTIKYIIKRDNDEKYIMNTDSDIEISENNNMNTRSYDASDDISNHISDDYLLTDDDTN